MPPKPAARTPVGQAAGRGGRVAAAATAAKSVRGRGAGLSAEQQTRSCTGVYTHDVTLSRLRTTISLAVVYYAS